MNSLSPICYTRERLTGTAREQLPVFAETEVTRLAWFLEVFSQATQHSSRTTPFLGLFKQVPGIELRLSGPAASTLSLCATSLAPSCQIL